MLISQAIGAMPIGEWKGNTEQPATKWLTQPNPNEARSNTVAAWVCDLLDHGNAVGAIDEHYATGEAWSVVPIPAARGRGQRWPRRGTGHLWRGQKRLGGIGDVFHAKGTQRPGDLRGMGVLEAGLNTIQRMTAEGAYASKAFTSGMPSGLLRVRDPDLQPGTADDASWVRHGEGHQKGVDGEHRGW